MSGPAQYRNRVRVSERHGAGEWTVERLSLVALLPLGLWVAVSGFTLAGADHAAVMDWFARPVNAGLAAATAMLFCLYASLAWKVIIEDYIHRPSSKTFLTALSNLAFLVLTATAVFFIVRLHVGSAPLPAGFGI
ncbi:MAG: succinate dehydrogenase, hydrophobic membrane anchor protein [Alphaproteobacteria bacterium]|nr:succinate dehydrogenase, hydrophobic membrane anchor protein [Alphaproteobacteria bacterium]MBU1526470.1 succinate dehydrogenase, hydrophobic membrane anchor protein [Alphaproteobacteria bacterium]MBU2116735.1 succinate dehydrogenase, hydrophobic membrane anchor protein [Alphaproteobacteria bacterium]MBU2350312.1 succinate dehydrogenase, hydrophobic membrane anchor protein [Alphaproteobacteria bacterium]MBU2382524.1 succinate dehydrogenase, hydrophobic membrane anchor protein [Alphaproteobac